MSQSIPIAIAPLTAVHFGDGRPNAAGETDFSSGRFPPSPRTVQGLVRTTLLRSVENLELGRGANPDEIEGLVGPPGSLRAGWQIRGPWPARWAEDIEGRALALEPWLPAPGWLARGRDGQLHFLCPRHPEDVRTDAQAPVLMMGAGKYPRAWLSPADALRVLRGLLPKSPHLDLPPFVGREPHTGLQLDAAKRSAEEGMLYTLDFHRFRDRSGLALRLDATFSPRTKRSALSSGTASLGAKNRVARLVHVERWQEDFAAVMAGDHLPASPPEGARFLVWATTPVLARDPLDPGLRRLDQGGARAEVLSAALGPPEPIGGFSMAALRGGVTRRYLPPGSAWLVALRGGDGAARGRLLREIHDSCVLGDDAGERSFGYGHALVALPPLAWSDA